MKNLRKIAAIVLALLFIVSAFAGCNKPEEETGPAFTYVPEYNTLSIDVGTGGYLDNVYYAGGKVYATASIADGTETYTDPETGESWEDTKFVTKFYFMNPDGSDIKELTSFKLAGSKSDGNSYTNENISNIFTAGDKVYLLKSSYSSTNDPDTGAYSYTESAYLCEIDAEGAIVSEKLAYERSYDSSKDSGESTEFTPNNIRASKDGTKWYLVGNTGVRVCDSELNELFTVEGTDINDCVVLPDGRVVITTWGDTGLVFKVLDETKKAFGESQSLPNNWWNIQQGNDEYPLIGNNDSGIYGLNIETGESTKIVDYIDADLDPDNIGSVFPLDDGNFFCYSTSWDDQGGNKTELITLKKTDSATVTEKKVIKLAMMSMDYNTRTRIIDFNKTNPEYRISVTDYSEFNTDSDYSAGLTKLNTEITSGTIPDIFVCSGMPIDKYASKGIFEDITPYLEKDFGADAMVDAFRKALTTDDGKLYELYSAFYVETWYGLKKVVGDGTSWTYKDMQAALATLQPGATIFEPYYDRSSATSLFLSANMESYVDWETGECHFDSDDFIGLLEATNLFPKEYNWEDNQDETNESTIKRLTSGKQLLASAYMYDLNSVRGQTWYQTKEELSFVGLPTNSGTGSTFGPAGEGYCISSTSQYKDVCWDFIKQIFEYDETTANSGYYWGIPTNKKAYEKAFETAMTPIYPDEEAESGSSSVTYSSYYGGGSNELVVLNDKYGPATSADGKTEIAQTTYGTDDGQFEIFAMTAEERTMIEDIINNTTAISRYDDSLTTIINEECEAFFSGQKSAADTAQMIQSRVKLYVNEQK